MTRKGFTHEEDGTLTVPLENIWQRARRWAKRNGREVNESYGVVDGAPF